MKAFLISAMVLILPISLEGQNVIEGQNWNGELFSQKQGALIFDLEYDSVVRDRLAQNIEVYVVNIINKKTYQLLIPKLSPFQPETFSLFKLPSGKYHIKKIRFMTFRGRQMRWDSPKVSPESFFIVRQMISNAGTWKLSILKNRLQFKRTQFNVKKLRNRFNRYRESAAAIINSRSKLIQLKLGGKRIQEQAKNQRTTTKEALITMSQKRTIGFFYSVDLLQNNRYAQSFVNTLSQNDSILRTCYSQTLDQGSQGQGKVTFSILYSGSKKRIIRIQKSSGDQRLEKASQCLFEKLTRISFTISKTIAGRISFMMSYKTQ